MGLSEIWNSYRSACVFYDAHHPLTADALHLVEVLEKLYGSSAYLVNKAGYRYVVLSKADIARMFGVDANNISKTTIKDIAWQIRGLKVYCGGLESNRWNTCELISNAAYDKGYMVIVFSLAAADLFNNIDFRERVRLSPSVHWKSRYSHLIHNLLMYASCINSYAGLRSGEFGIEYSVEELRVILGIVNTNGFDFSDTAYSDFAAICNQVCYSAKELKYAQYAELYRNVLHPAIKELNTSPYSNFNVKLKKKVSAHNKTDYICLYVSVRCVDESSCK